MGIFGRLFGNEPPASGRRAAQPQPPGAQTVLGRCIVDFHDRTKLPFILIFPVVHKVAVKLYVEDFGIDSTLKHYERLLASLTSDGTIRENQFKSFGWPEVRPEDAARLQQLDAQLWKLIRELVPQGVLKETIANALVNLALTAAAKGIDPLLSAGFFVTVVKELRDGIYTPPPETRPEADDDTPELTKLVFERLRDSAYQMKDSLGLEWMHLLPGMHRVCVISCIKYRGKEGALELFHDQIRKLQPLLDDAPRNPPQQIPITPLHVTNMAQFNDLFLTLANVFLDDPDVHPLHVGHAISLLVAQLASEHYDLIFLSGLLTSSCADIEQGQYNFVTKTH